MLDSTKPVLHLQNPSRKPLTYITERCCKFPGQPLVEWSVWLDKLATAAAQVQRGELKPSRALQTAVQFLGLFQAVPDNDDPKRRHQDSFETISMLNCVEALSESPTLRAGNCDITDTDIRKSIEWWGTVGFFDAEN